jgi:hypothetical protein
MPKTGEIGKMEEIVEMGKPTSSISPASPFAKQTFPLLFIVVFQ